MALEIAELVSIRLRLSYKALADKLSLYHSVRGRGKLFELYLKEDMDKIKLEKAQAAISETSSKKS